MDFLFGEERGRNKLYCSKTCLHSTPTGLYTKEMGRSTIVQAREGLKIKISVKEMFVPLPRF